MNKLITKLAIAIALFASPALAADVDGTWNLNLDAAEGSTMVVLKITIEGENATGEASGETMTGTYIDGELKLAGPLYIADAGYSGEADMTAKLDGERLRGDMNWEGYDLSVSGTKK